MKIKTSEELIISVCRCSSQVPTWSTLKHPDFNKVSFFADVSNFLSLRAKQDKHRNQEAWGDLKTV